MNCVSLTTRPLASTTTATTLLRKRLPIFRKESSTLVRRTGPVETVRLLTWKVTLAMATRLVRAI